MPLCAPFSRLGRAVGLERCWCVVHTQPGPKHIIPCWPSSQGSFGMGSVCPEHLSLAKGGINSCLRLLGLGRAGSATGTDFGHLLCPIKGHDGASPLDQVGIVHPAPSLVTEVRPWRNLSAAEATAALGTQTVGPQLTIPLKSHFFAFNCPGRGTNLAFSLDLSCLGHPLVALSAEQMLHSLFRFLGCLSVLGSGAQGGLGQGLAKLPAEELGQGWLWWIPAGQPWMQGPGAGWT